MHLVFLDFESFWSDEVTLKKMSPGEYLAHPEFELQSVSVRVDEGGKTVHPTSVHFGEREIRYALDSVNPSSAMVVGHNMSGFDSLIFSWKLGYTPRMYGCTLSMARPVLGHVSALGLGALVKLYEIGVKNDAVLHQTKGRHLVDFTPEELEAMRLYNGDDTDQCAALFYKLAKRFTPAELWQIDCTIRARAEPKLELDIPLLEATLVKERHDKRTTLIQLAEALGIEQGPTDEVTFEAVRARLASQPKFVELLESLGVDVPYKPSTSDPTKFIPALAKTDEGFEELLESEDPLVAQAAAARLSVKSTLLETRIGKLITARRCATALPIPLKYAGAKVTDRWSGEEYNPQNLPRIDIKNKGPQNSDALRQSLMAPKGFVIGVADQSGVELRVNHHFWKVRRSMQLYKENVLADLYRDFASSRWHVPPADVTALQRQTAKHCHLSLQYGSGAAKLRHTARVIGGLLLAPEESLDLTLDWRRTYHEIPSGWNDCADALFYIREGSTKRLDQWGLTHTCKDGIMLPNGSLMRYPALRQEEMKDAKTGEIKTEWVYGVGRFTRRIYGPKVCANLIQKLARNIVAEDALAFFNLTGYRWVSMTHDELIYLFPEKEAPALLAALQGQMRSRRTWWPELVLWSEGGLGERYSEAH